MKIRAYLALMVAAIVVPVILFSTLTLNTLLKAERDAAMKGMRETARTAMVSIDRELTNSQAAVRMLATSHHLDHGNLAGFYEQAKYADRSNATYTALLDENGQQLMNTAVPFGTPLPPRGAAVDRIKLALATGQPQISNLIRGAVTNSLLVVVDVPLTTPSGKRYVIVQGFLVGHMRNVLTQLNVPNSWVAGVFDRNGLAIAHLSNDRKSGEPPHKALREAIRAQTSGIIPNDDGEERMYTMLERSRLSGWTVAVGVPRKEIESAARSTLVMSALGLLAAIGCATATALFFARRLSHSIRLVATSAHALERGDDILPPVSTGVGEVDEVQNAIHAAALVVHEEKVSRQHAEAEREKLLASEHAARTEAEQQNRAKDEFLAMLGHELRNPLAAISNAVSVLGLTGMSGESVERARQVMKRQSQHLSRIVDDLLDVGRVHSGKVLLERRHLRLDQMVLNYIATLEQMGRASRHKISSHTDPAWVNADPTRIEQIIANLLDNAIKYTPAGGAIHVGVWVEDEEVVLNVSDSGTGIGPDLLPYVFDLFVQGKRALDRAQGGLGVGLALVRRLAGMHGGSVSAASEGAGNGSTFEVRLPRVDAPPSLAQQPALPSASGQSVLLVEDNQDGRVMMTIMLENHGYKVLAAEDGISGLEIAAKELPTIALIDIGLPGIDGFEVARRLRADPVTREMRLIALTGYGQANDKKMAFSAGFDAHLVKPVDLPRLVEAMEGQNAVEAAQ
jgi:signal transduction histidine kinase/ActR/RegA family two-component response regulator